MWEYMNRHCQPKHCTDSITQKSDSKAKLDQKTDQLNDLNQGISLAIAIHNGSYAEAIQQIDETNKNNQLALSQGININHIVRPKDNCTDKESSKVNAKASKDPDIKQLHKSRCRPAIAIAIDGGEAEARIEGIAKSKNSYDVHSKSLNKSHPPISSSKHNKKEVQRSDTEKEKSHCLRFAKAKADDCIIKAVIEADFGDKKFSIQIWKNGTVYLNGKRVRSFRLKKEA